MARRAQAGRRVGGGRRAARHERDLVELLGPAVPSLRVAALVLTGDAARAGELLRTVLERAVTAWPALVRTGDPVALLHERLVRAAGPDGRTARAPDPEAPDLRDLQDLQDLRDLPDGPLSDAPPYALLAAVAGLTPTQRAALVLRELAGVDQARAAQVQRLDPATVAAAHTSALAHVGAALGEVLAPRVDPELVTDTDGVEVLDLTSPDLP